MFIKLANNIGLPHLSVCGASPNGMRTALPLPIPHHQQPSPSPTTWLRVVITRGEKSNRLKLLIHENWDITLSLLFNVDVKGLLHTELMNITNSKKKISRVTRNLLDRLIAQSRKVARFSSGSNANGKPRPEPPQRGDGERKTQLGGLTKLGGGGESVQTVRQGDAFSSSLGACGLRALWPPWASTLVVDQPQKRSKLASRRGRAAGQGKASVAWRGRASERGEVA